MRTKKSVSPQSTVEGGQNSSAVQRKSIRRLCNDFDRHHPDNIDTRDGYTHAPSKAAELSPPKVLTSRGYSSISMDMRMSEAQSAVEAVRVKDTSTAGQSGKLFAVDAAATYFFCAGGGKHAGERSEGLRKLLHCCCCE